MISDQRLAAFLADDDIIVPQMSDLTGIGLQGEHLIQWQLNFNRLSVAQMYTEYTLVVTELMHVSMDEGLRLSLMEKVMQVGNRLLANLHQLYQNYSGFLNEGQQQALDMALSVHYLGIMFFQSVWQRVSSLPEAVPKNRFGGWLSRQAPLPAHERLVQVCLYGMISLLNRALCEKHLGYRKDTQVIWQYLNACYRFALSRNWQAIGCDLPSLHPKHKQPSLATLYVQCVINELSNPYACRRADILQTQSASIHWVEGMIATVEHAKKPFIYVDLQSAEPPQVVQPTTRYNPFSQGSQVLFINIEPLMQRLAATIVQAKHSSSNQDKLAARHANILLYNLNEVYHLTTPTGKPKTLSHCQAVVGFQQIHYMLANRTNFGKLIQSHLLPDHLRPLAQDSHLFDKWLGVTMVSQGDNHYYLTRDFDYRSMGVAAGIQALPASAKPPHVFGHLQVRSLVALYHGNQPKLGWQLHGISQLQQRPRTADLPDDTNEPPDTITLTAKAKIKLIGEGIVACGVRLQQAGNRSAYFVPALIIPRNAKLGHQYTSLMMARFGYQIGDRLIMRIDDNEATIALTELINFSDDVETYNFIRLS